MKTKKYGIILLLIMVINLFITNKSVVQASDNEENVKTYGHFQYIYIQETDSIEIVGYVGNEKVVMIPAEIEGKPVRVISNFDDYFDSSDMFTANRKVKEVYISDGILEISGFSFKKNLEKVYIGDSVQIIGMEAFNGCKKLKNVKMPTGLLELGVSAFAGCSSLTKITIPYGVETICDDAFFGCTSLKKIIIPDSVTRIGEEAFCCCENLDKVKLSQNLKVIDTEAFEKCNIKKLEIPNKVTTIGDDAFASNSFTKVTIPSSVKTIGYSAFEYCRKLKKITIKGTKVKKIKRDAFRNIHPKAVFDVPNKQISKYKKC